MRVQVSLVFRQIWLLAALAAMACGNGAVVQDGAEPLIGEDANWASEGPFEEKIQTYEDENRDIWQQPDRVIDLIGPLEGKTVVDLGASSGYFTFRMLPQAGKVIAVELDPQFVAFLEEKKSLLPAELQAKFETRQARPDDPMLRAGEADAILLVSTYVYIDDRVAYFRRLKDKLSPDGKIVIIEFKKKSIPNGPPANEKMPLSEVEQELEAAGYRILATDDQTLAYQYIVTAGL